VIFNNLSKKPLAIFAGKGNLPQILINQCIKNNQKFHLFLLAQEHYEIDYSHYFPRTISFGQVGKFLEIMTKNKIENLVFVGAITKPNFAQIINLDAQAKILLAKILANKILGDNAVLKTVVKFFSQKNIKIIGIEEIIDCTINKVGNLGIVAPNKLQLENIAIAVAAIKKFSTFDVGQAVAISQKQIIAVEAVEGTDEMIKRCKNLNIDYKNQAILVKMKKAKQSKKIDLPTIGLETLKNCLESGFVGIAVQKNSTLLIDKNQLIEFANQHNLFIHIFS